MSKSVSRSARRALALRKSPGCIVADNLSNPVKPQARSLERSHCAPNALGALSARFSDPAGNVFSAKHVGRVRHAPIALEQGPLVFSVGPDGVKRCKRVKPVRASITISGAMAPVTPSLSLDLAYSVNGRKLGLWGRHNI